MNYTSSLNNLISKTNRTENELTVLSLNFLEQYVSFLIDSDIIYKIDISRKYINLIIKGNCNILEFILDLRTNWSKSEVNKEIYIEHIMVIENKLEIQFRPTNNKLFLK